MDNGKVSDWFLELGRASWRAFWNAFLESPVLMFGIPWLCLRHGQSMSEAETQLRAWMLRVGWLKDYE